MDQLQAEQQRAREKLDTNIEAISYSDYSKDRLGCCGGDYCEGNHNENIGKFLDSSIASAFSAGVLEGRKLERERIYYSISGKHIVARSSYSSESWDAGYHDALFACEKIALKEETKTL